MARNNNKKKNKKSGPGMGRNIVVTARSVTATASPAGKTYVNKVRAPQMYSTNQGLVVRNSEVILRRSSASAAVVGGWAGVNPADVNLFGWLARIARSYSYYRWKRVRINYVSGCATGLSGDMTMGLFYDYEDANAWGFLGSITALTQTEHAVQGPVWGSTSHVDSSGRMISTMYMDVDVERAHMRTPWHLIDAANISAVSDNQSVAFYIGHALAPNGAGTVFAGSIWVDYEIEFRHPATVDANQTLRSITSGRNFQYPANPDGSRKEPEPEPAPTPAPAPSPAPKPPIAEED